MRVEPQLAIVKPRILRPGDSAPIRLEDFVRMCAREQPRGAIGVSGPPGSGKTSAMRHLAAACTDLSSAIFLDEPSTHAERSAARTSFLVFVVDAELEVPQVEHVTLAAWTLDDCAEYLLATNRPACRSVMQRLAAAGDESCLRGLPALWTLVLDAMATDESLLSVEIALAKIFDSRIEASAGREAATKLAVAIALKSGRKHIVACSVKFLYHAGEERMLQLALTEPVSSRLVAERLVSRASHGRHTRLLRVPLDPAVIRRFGAQLRALQRHDAASATAALVFLDKAVSDRTSDDPVQRANAVGLLLAHDRTFRPDRAPDAVGFSSGEFADAQWGRLSLKDSSFENCNLRDADLSHARLWNCAFRECSLYAANLYAADLTGASFESCHAAGAMFDDVIAREVPFASHFTGASFVGARLDRAKFEMANVSDCRFDRASLVEANFTLANIDGASFIGADLTRATLSGLRLSVANFTNAWLEGASLIACDLAGIALPGAQMTCCDLSSADLSNAALPGAKLTGANLRNAGLAGVNLEHVDLRAADFADASFHMGSSRSGLVQSPLASEGTRMGFYTNEFDEQHYRSPEDIRVATLRGADLRDARVTDCDFYLVDLRDATYDSTQADHFRRCGAILEARV